MAKVAKEIELAEEALAFEMIELACGELDNLSRAFNMINDLCVELQADVEDLEVSPAKFQIN